MIFRVRVCGVGGDDVTDPTERAAGANPEAGRNDEPENAGEYATVVKLANARNDETKKSCGKWIAHRLSPPFSELRNPIRREAENCSEEVRVIRRTQTTLTREHTSACCQSGSHHWLN